MPKLPSGREVAIRAERLIEMLRQYANTGEPAALAQVHTARDLYPYIDVLYFRPREGGSAVDNYLPAGLEPYPSGHTLADLDALTRDWPQTDRAAFRAFLAEERTRKYLHELLESVRLAQLVRSEPTPATMLQAVAIVHPELLGIDDDATDEEPLALEPLRLEAHVLAAIARVAVGARAHERLYAPHATRFERAWVFVRLAFEHNRGLLQKLIDPRNALADVAARVRAALATDEFPEPARSWIERQLWHEVINLWPALDNEDARELFKEEHDVLEQAWASPQVARVLDKRS